MCDTSMMPLRVAIPNRVMKPTIDATDRTPPARYTPRTPPISASGRLIMISRPSRDEPNAAERMKKIATTTPSESQRSCLRRLGLALELTAVLDVIALRQLDVLGDALLNVVDDAAQVPSGDVALDDDSALDVLPHDEVRAAILLNGCDSGQRNLAPVRRLDLRAWQSRRAPSSRPGRNERPAERRSAPEESDRRHGRRAPSAGLPRLSPTRALDVRPPPDRRAPSASECRSAPLWRGRRRPPPATSPTCTWLASWRSVGRSSPKILTAMFARVPESMWSMRCEIGWPIVTFVPGQQRDLLPDLLEQLLRAAGPSSRDARRSPPIRRPARARRARRGRFAAPWTDFRHAEQQPLERIAERVRVGEARARNRHGADGQGAFVELGQKRSARCNDARQRDDQQQRRQRPDDCPPVRERMAEPALVRRLQASRQPRLAARRDQSSIRGSSQEHSTGVTVSATTSDAISATT